MADDTNSNSNRGLASADEQTRKRVASMGGKAQSHEAKQRAGKKGGQASGGNNS